MPYTPASGTTQSGVLFPVYTNKTAGYSFEYPGGWRVAEKGSGVRIARFGDAVTVVVRPRQQAPSSKGYQKQLEAMLQQHDDKIISKIVRPASVITVGKDKVTMAVIEQVRPTGPGADAPKDTLVVNRYLFWNDGKLAAALDELGEGRRQQRRLEPDGQLLQVELSRQSR